MFAFERAAGDAWFWNNAERSPARTGADDETARRNFESHGEEDHVAGSRRGGRGNGPNDTADAGTVPGVRLRRIARPVTPETDHAASADGDGRAGIDALSGDIL